MNYSNKKLHIVSNETAQYMLTSLISLGIIGYMVHIWGVNLKIPLLQYGGDQFSHASQIKSIIEGGWIYKTSFLGAPFGALFFDYPTSDSLHYLFFFIFSFFTRNPIVILNIYYLGSFPLAAISALFVFKKLNIPFYIALPGAVSFAFLPFHLLRYEHLYLSAYYMVPLGLSVFLDAVVGNLKVVSWDQKKRKLSINLMQPKLWLYLLICGLVASSGIYYAYFIAFIGCISAVWCLFLDIEGDKLSRMISCLVLVFFLALTTALNGAPSFIYSIINGVPSEVIAVRAAAEAEIYGGKIIQMLLPSPIHRFSPLAGITRSYIATTPLVNENSTASLGFIGVIGFLYSLFLLFRQKRINMFDRYLSFINIFCVFLGTIGGLGSLIAFFILPNIRAYNRISVVIGFISILIFSRLVQHLVDMIKSIFPYEGKKNIVFSTGLSIFLLTIIFIDQCSFPNFVGNYQMNMTSYKNDSQFAGEIEEIVPPGAMIFQLPFMPFPENGPIYKMQDYDHLRPYLYTSDLKWSYGDSKGRKASNWNQATAFLPIEQMLQRLAGAGFSGIYIDRFGYQDTGEDIQASIRLYVEGNPIVSEDQRFVFYDISSFRDEYRSKYTEDQWKEISEQALKLESKIMPSGECSPAEGEPGNQWIWCGDKGELVVFDYEEMDRNVVLQFDVSTGTGENAVLFIESKNLHEQFTINGIPQLIQLNIPMKAEQNSRTIFIETNAQSFDPGTGDPRELAVKLSNITLGNVTIRP
jgi:hypothetical protein